MARTEKSSKIGKIVIRSVKRSSDGRRLQLRSKTGSAGLHETENCRTRMTKEAKKSAKHMTKSPKEESRPLLYLGFDDQLS